MARPQTSTHPTWTATKTFQETSPACQGTHFHYFCPLTHGTRQSSNQGYVGLKPRFVSPIYLKQREQGSQHEGRRVALHGTRGHLQPRPKRGSMPSQWYALVSILSLPALGD